MSWTASARVAGSLLSLPRLMTGSGRGEAEAEDEDGSIRCTWLAMDAGKKQAGMPRRLVVSLQAKPAGEQAMCACAHSMFFPPSSWLALSEVAEMNKLGTVECMAGNGRIYRPRHPAESAAKCSKQQIGTASGHRGKGTPRFSANWPWASTLYVDF